MRGADGSPGVRGGSSIGAAWVPLFTGWALRLVQQLGNASDGRLAVSKHEP